MRNSLHLLATQRFLPLFITQFLGAFNDNLFKNALVILITYRMAAAGLPQQEAQQMTVLAAGLFILPFFMLSATAGQVADKFEKSGVMRTIKIIEIALMTFGTIGFLTHHTWMLMCVLFGMGTHSTFFGPLKYGVLPEHLQQEELLAGNGLIEAGTFMAILLGTIIGGLLILQPGGESWVSAGLLVVAITGYSVSRRIPHARAAVPQLTTSWNIAAGTWHLFQQARAQKSVFISILGISWFWFVGASFLAQFPAYVRYHLAGNAQVITLVLTMFSLGIAIGSVYCNRLMKGEIHAGFVPIGALGMGLCTLVLVWLSPASHLVEEAALLSASQWLVDARAWGILLSLLGISIFGGIFTVPLYALIQHHAKPSERSRMMAANNIVNSFFMVTSAVLCLVLLKLNWTVVDIFLGIGLANIPVAGWLFAIRKHF